MLRVFATLALIMAFGPARAEILPALSATGAADWRAVGVVNLEGPNGRALCSGVLVAPDLVLSAAHCAGGPMGKRHFLVGGIADKTLSAHVADSITEHPDYATTSGTARYAFDLALIKLASPVPTRIATPLRLSDAAPDGPLGIVGYHRMRPGDLNARFDCPKTHEYPFNAMLIGCQVIAGNSGAPMVVPTATGWEIAGIVVARIDAGTSHAALVALPDDWLRSSIAAHGE